MVRLGIFIATLSACLSAYAAPLKIGVSESMLSLPFYVAQSENLFRKRGVELELVSCSGGHQCLANMLAGKTELATAAELPVVLKSFVRNDFSIVTSFVSASNNVKIVVRDSARIEEPVHLKDATIAYVKGATSQYVLDLVLVYHGIDSNTVKMRPYPADGIVKALFNREVDALSVWEPLASSAIEDLKGEARVLSTPRLYTETFNLVATHSVIQKRPRDMEKVLAALKDANEFIDANPEKVKAMAAKRLGIPTPVVNQIFNDYRYQLGLSRGLLRTMEGQARWAIREGHVDSKSSQPDLTRYVYPAFLRSVDRNTVQLQ